MPDFGPAHWGVPAFRRCLVNGRPYRLGTGTLAALAFSGPGIGPARLLTEEGGTVVQYRWTGGRAPLSLGARELQLQLAADTLDDYLDLQRVLLDLAGLRLFLEVPMVDRWYIPGRSPGQTTWLTSRRLPYGLHASVTRESHPPIVRVDGVEQDVLSSGTPTSGQVVVPDAGGWSEITTPLDLTGTYLELLYHPELVFVGAAEFAVPSYNELSVSLPAAEVLRGSYA